MTDEYIVTGQMSIFDQDFAYGKMFREHLAQTKETISELSWKNLSTLSNQTLMFLDARKSGASQELSSEIIGALRGEPLTLNIGESPQRRKRIALVMDFADRCAGEILFERESVSGDSVESIEAWKGIATNPERSVGECYTDESYTLKIRGGATLTSTRGMERRKEPGKAH